MKIRKKPVVVQGWPVADLLDLAKVGPGVLPPSVRAAYEEGVIEFEVDRLMVATMEGLMVGALGWWLIEGVQGEFYPCDGDVFRQTYDIVPSVQDGEGIEVRFPQIDPYANSPEV